MQIRTFFDQLGVHATPRPLRRFVELSLNSFAMGLVWITQ